VAIRRGIQDLAISGLAVGAILAGCSFAAPSLNLLGGREKCWSEAEPRLATVMKGRLELGAYPWSLDTPEGEVFGIDFAGPRLDATGTQLLDASGNKIADEGEMVTVFGGLGSDGVIMVCGIEERHAA
jgi:hypothetical protein